MLPEHGLVESFHEESVLSDLSFVPAARFLENGIPAVIVSFEEERVLLFGLGGVVKFFALSLYSFSKC